MLKFLKRLFGCREDILLEANESLLELLDLYQDDSEKPEWLKDGNVYKPKICVETETVELRPQDIYAISDKMWAIDGFRNLPHDEKLMKIWEFIVNNVTYVFDDPENWQFASTTLERRKGDCEDGTILFLVLCKLSGIRASEVFNACGLLKLGDKEIGHSWPIAKMSDGKWYIFESTLDKLPDKPMLFKGSQYKPVWGFQNWKFSGSTNGEQI